MRCDQMGCFFGLMAGSHSGGSVTLDLLRSMGEVLGRVGEHGGGESQTGLSPRKGATQLRRREVSMRFEEVAYISATRAEIPAHVDGRRIF